MVIFHSYVSLPEGNLHSSVSQLVCPQSDSPVISGHPRASASARHCSSAKQRRRKDFKVPGVGAAPAMCNKIPVKIKMKANKSPQKTGINAESWI